MGFRFKNALLYNTGILLNLENSYIRILRYEIFFLSLSFSIDFRWLTRADIERIRYLYHQKLPGENV